MDKKTNRNWRDIKLYCVNYNIFYKYYNIMKIGIIGLGMVGKAIFDGLSLNKNNELCFYDIKFSESKITDVINTEIIYISVPTLPDQNNKCDLSILFNIIEELNDLNYFGIICIKSTIIPETTINLINKYN